MKFEERLQKAIHRGQLRGDQRREAAEARALSEDELKTLHSKCRLEMSERIESCIAQVPRHFPGFDYETIYGERGWGAAIRRDDIQIKRPGKRDNQYSRLEMTIRPFSQAHVLDLAAKGTVRNREIFNRNHFEKIEEVDLENFSELIDLWILEYVELFAAQT